MTKILVTGGAGFIGSNFIRYWHKKYPNHKIVNLDKLTYAGHLSSLSDFEKNKNYEFIKGDVCDPEVVARAMKYVHLVVHFAAESHVDRSIKDPVTVVKTNVLGTATLLEAAWNNQVAHFHHVSTDEVFGSLPLTGTKKFTEATMYDPRSPYSASKAASDHLVRAYHHTYGLPITITNCSNNFGSFQDPEKFLPRFITNLIDGKKIPVYGKGENIRDWLHVEDHVRAIEMVINRGKLGQTYLVGGQTENVTNLAIAKKLVKIFGLSEDMIEYVADRPGHDLRYSVDWSKINHELGWEPQYDFETWLTNTVEWYKINEWWWRPLKAEAEKLYEDSK